MVVITAVRRSVLAPGPFMPGRGQCVGALASTLTAPSREVEDGRPMLVHTPSLRLWSRRGVLDALC